MSYKFLRGNLSGAVGNSDLYVTELSASDKLTLGSAYSFTSAGALTAGAIAGTTISGSGAATFGSTLRADGNLTAGSALAASGLANLDGGIEVDAGGSNKFTVSTAGAVSGAASLSVGNALIINDYGITRAGAATLGASTVSTLGATGLASLDGGINVDDNFTVSAAGAVVAVGVNAGGAITGATTVSGSGNFSVGGNLVLNDFSITRAGVATLGAVTATGDVVLGGDTGDDVTITGRIAADIDPKADNNYDLGAADLQWKDLYVNGIGYIDQLGTDADPVAAYIGSGEIDGAAIGSESQSSGKFTTLSASSTLIVDGASTFNSLANLDGGIEIDNSGNKFTVSTAGAIFAAGEAELDGGLNVNDIFEVSTAGAVEAAGITSSAGIVAQGGQISGSGDFGVGGVLAIKQASGSAGSTRYAFIGEDTAAGLKLFFRNNSNQKQAVVGTLGTDVTTELRMEAAAQGNLEFVMGAGNGSFRFKNSSETVGLSISAAGALSGAAGLQASTLQASNTQAGVPTLSSDSLIWIDSGVLKSRSFSAYADSIAGTGITATNGVLSVDTTGGDSITVTKLGNANATLVAGLNYPTASISTARTWTLPASPDVGDVVYVKGDENLNGSVKITIARAGSQVIDDSLTSIDLVSPNASVGLVYTSASAGTLCWKII